MLPQMKDKIALVFYYHPLNRYSFNALAGAMDGEPELAELPVTLAKTEDQLLRACIEAQGRHNRVFVAFSVLTPQSPDIDRIVRRLRSDHRERVIVLAGGPHVTADPHKAIEAGADVAFRGEAEKTFSLALQRLTKDAGLEGIEGIAFRQGDRIQTGPPPAPVPIDDFASFSPRRGMLGPIEITRGCPFACNYCQTSRIFGVKPRHRSVSRIAGQAAELRVRGRNVVRLLSPNAFSYGSADGIELNLAALEDLLSTLREVVSQSGRIVFAHFPSEARPEHVTPETLDLLRRYANNDEIVIGAQSGSDRLLQACHRSHSAATVLNAVSLARKSGYKIIVDFILGLPGENSRDVAETAAVIKELARMGARIHPHAFVPLPQTPYGNHAPGKMSPEILALLEQIRERRGVYGDCTGQHQMAERLYQHESTDSGIKTTPRQAQPDAK